MQSIHQPTPLPVQSNLWHAFKIPKPFVACHVLCRSATFLNWPRGCVGLGLAVALVWMHIFFVVPFWVTCTEIALGVAVCMHKSNACQAWILVLQLISAGLKKCSLRVYSHCFSVNDPVRCWNTCLSINYSIVGLACIVFKLVFLQTTDALHTLLSVSLIDNTLTTYTTHTSKRL